MKANSKGVGRRDFIRGTVGAVLVGASSAACKARKGSDQKDSLRTETVKRDPSQTADVVLVRNADVLDADGSLRADVLQRMLDDAVVELFGAPDPVAAFKRLVRPEDTVGIKSNVWRHLPTPPELEQALQQRLVEAGVSAERIGVDDRGVRDNPIFQQATALINVRPLRTHHWAGIGSCIKNYIMFSDEPASFHPDACASLASAWSLPQVKGKTRLNILVMLTPQFHSKGPHNFQKQYTWPYRGLVVGQDPVAVDATGLRILEAKRREHFGGDRPFYVSAKHVEVADRRYGLGVADQNRIKLRKLGWMEQSLL